MTLEVFPNLDGLTYEIDLALEFNTHLFRPIDRTKGRESTVALQEFPIMNFTVNFDFLIKERDENQLLALLGFFYRQRGRLNTWLFDWPEDNAATNVLLGTGNGVTTDFPLRRAIGGVFEPTNFINPVEDPLNLRTFSPYIYVDGDKATPGTDYTVTAAGVLQFITPPASGAIIRWYGNYHYVCRFTEDTLKLNQIGKNFHEAQSLQFYGSVIDIL